MTAAAEEEEEEETTTMMAALVPGCVANRDKGGPFVTVGDTTRD
jgi:hypothetical protein